LAAIPLTMAVVNEVPDQDAQPVSFGSAREGHPVRASGK